MKIVFLMGGANIQKNQDDYPFYLTEINEKLILEKQIDYCKPLNVSEFIFCIKCCLMKFILSFIVPIDDSSIPKILLRFIRQFTSNSATNTIIIPSMHNRQSKKWI